MLKFFNKKENLFYPTSEVKIWQELKNLYNKFGYEWVDLDSCKNETKIRKTDENNMKKFLELKTNESKLRSSLRGVKVPFIVPPPKPNNHERYLLLKKWSKNKTCFDISMAAVDLYKNFDLEPCKDYDPCDVLSIYYDEKRKDQNFSSSSSSSSSSISLSNRQPATAPPPSRSSGYNELIPFLEESIVMNKIKDFTI